MKNSRLLDIVQSIVAEGGGKFSLVWRDDMDFNDNAQSFSDALKPHLIEKRRVKHWPGTTLDRVAATIYSYYLNQESSALLVSAPSPLQFLSPDFPEDLAIYNRRDELLYASCAHEGVEWFPTLDRK